MGRIALALLLFATCSACATPPPVKQALVSMDDQYDTNLKLMKQYRELVVGLNARHQYWYQYVKIRATLDLALKLAATDPKGANDPKVVDEWGKLLGPDLVKYVNEVRLADLPERRGNSTVFVAGKAKANTLLEGIPGLVDKVAAVVSANSKQDLPAADLSPFDVYDTNVRALRQVNAIITRYLEIDVTVKPQDVKDIADAIRTLR
jgi:hypothetical protein